MAHKRDFCRSTSVAQQQPTAAGDKESSSSSPDGGLDKPAAADDTEESASAHSDSRLGRVSIASLWSSVLYYFVTYGRTVTNFIIRMYTRCR